MENMKKKIKLAFFLIQKKFLNVNGVSNLVWIMFHKLSESPMFLNIHCVLKIRPQRKHSDLFSMSHDKQLSQNVLWDLAQGE